MDSKHFWSAVLALAWAGGPATADDFQLHPIFSNGVVLQQGQPIRVWGAGENGRSVSVSLHGQSASAVVANDRWSVELPPLPAGGPYELEIRGDRVLRVEDVLIGDVFVCSGQSNMEWPLQLSANGGEAVAAARPDSQLRMLQVQHAVADQPREDFASAGWESAAPDTVGKFSAVGYYFGRRLREARQIPIGLIQATWSGTVAEGWTSRQTVTSHQALRSLLDDPAGANPGNPNYAGRLFNGLIAPLTKFPIAGVLWYQGESNVDRAQQYRTLFPALIADWRNHWGRADLPFLFVQLAPFGTPSPTPQESSWAALREAQREVSETVPNSAMVVITDAGDADIHPPHKQPVGERLAQAALHLLHGHPVDARGPRVTKAEVRDGGVWLSFDRVAEGLRVRGPLSGFSLAGADGVYRPALAQLRGKDLVEVTCAEVPAPQSLRYGWDTYPVVNLYDSHHVPASPFQLQLR
jgi:sialate O-acetylesterase